MRFLLLFIVFSFLSSCSQKKHSNQLPPKVIFANEIRKKVASDLYKKKNLVPCGSGGGMMRQVEMLALSFDYRKPIDIKMGRELLIAAVDELTVAVNADERIRPYLQNYPFEPKNIEIRIFLYNPDGSDIPPGSLSVVGALEGVLDYKIRDPKTDQLKSIHKETYEEAVRILLGSEASKDVINL
ncbi:MAG: hypothetical protein KGJ02_04410 [Verrucomicrobiota bacterium]|nr:hypothetical protein [Verrucomicrobiota bacterium]